LGDARRHLPVPEFLTAHFTTTPVIEGNSKSGVAKNEVKFCVCLLSFFDDVFSILVLKCI